MLLLHSHVTMQLTIVTKRGMSECSNNVQKFQSQQTVKSTRRGISESKQQWIELIVHYYHDTCGSEVLEFSALTKAWAESQHSSQPELQTFACRKTYLSIWKMPKTLPPSPQKWNVLEPILASLGVLLRYVAPCWRHLAPTWRQDGAKTSKKNLILAPRRAKRGAKTYQKRFS